MIIPEMILLMLALNLVIILSLWAFPDASVRVGLYAHTPRRLWLLWGIRYYP